MVSIRQASHWMAHRCIADLFMEIYGVFSDTNEILLHVG